MRATDERDVPNGRSADVASVNDASALPIGVEWMTVCVPSVSGVSSFDWPMFMSVSSDSDVPTACSICSPG